MEGNASSGGGEVRLRSDEHLSWEDGMEKYSFRILEKKMVWSQDEQEETEGLNSTKMVVGKEREWEMIGRC